MVKIIMNIGYEVRKIIKSEIMSMLREEKVQMKLDKDGLTLTGGIFWMTEDMMKRQKDEHRIARRRAWRSRARGRRRRNF